MCMCVCVCVSVCVCGHVYVCVLFCITKFWRDEFLTWDPEDWDGLDHLVVLPTDIWLPDFLMRNRLLSMWCGLVVRMSVVVVIVVVRILPVPQQLRHYIFTVLCFGEHFKHAVLLVNDLCVC